MCLLSCNGPQGATIPVTLSCGACDGTCGTPSRSRTWQRWRPSVDLLSMPAASDGSRSTVRSWTSVAGHLKPTNRSWRLDETYINVKGRDRFLYRAVDSTGQTIDFLLTDRRDTAAAKRFFRRALLNGNAMPRVISVDKNPAYPRAVEDLKREGAISRRCRLRQCKYLNNVVEQDHRNVKRRS